MTSLQFLLFALRVNLNVLRFRNEQALLCYFYFVFIVLIKKITDPQNSPFLAHPVYAQSYHKIRSEGLCVKLTVLS